LNALSATLRSGREFVRELDFVLGGGLQRLSFVVSLILLSTVLELLGVAMVGLLLTLATTAPGQAVPLPAWLGGLSSSDLPRVSAALFTIFVFKGFAAYWVRGSIARLTAGERARLMSRLLAAYQAKPYEFHCNRNSSDLINTVVWHTNSFAGAVLGSLFVFISDGMVFLVLGLFLAWADPRAVVLLAAVIGIVFVVVARFVRPRLGRAVQISRDMNREVFESVSQSLGALREVRVLGREAFFARRLNAAADALCGASAAETSLQVIPRQAIEIAMVGFLVVLVWLAHSVGGFAMAAIPVLGTFAVASVRLMPASTSLLSSWSTLRAYRFTLRELARELADAGGASAAAAIVPEPPAQAETFRSLELEGVAFTYPGATQATLRDVSLQIKAGEIVGLMGRSGAGKSTLADVILGLLQSTGGTVRVNGWDIQGQVPRWHRMAAYIPQTVYLLDDTLRRNIALGVSDDQIDAARIVDAVRLAQLEDLVAHLPQGLDTMVGERGVRLSGGQRQRVAVARALYHERQFLILDEATSALDEETEREVVESVRALRGVRSVLIIAHRESTLRAASRVLRLDEGRLADPKQLTLETAPDSQARES
jgi:ABC-type multidrug transport system fused ATPase/permease subunit